MSEPIFNRDRERGPASGKGAPPSAPPRSHRRSPLGGNLLAVGILAALLLPWLGVGRFLLHATGGGPLLPSLVASLLVTGAGLLVAIPVAWIAAALVFEYPTTLAARTTKWTVDLLAGIPTLLFGAVAAAIVLRLSPAWKAVPFGALILAVFPAGFSLLPRLFRAFLRAFARVPGTYREAALSLGASRAHTLIAVVAKSARRDLIAGVFVAAAHGFGELGPVLFLGVDAAPLPLRVLAAGLGKDRGAAAAASLVLVAGMFTFQALAALAQRPSADRGRLVSLFLEPRS